MALKMNPMHALTARGILHGRTEEQIAETVAQYLATFPGDAEKLERRLRVAADAAKAWRNK